jgi:hypothetical protein
VEGVFVYGFTRGLSNLKTGPVLMTRSETDAVQWHNAAAGLLGGGGVGGLALEVVVAPPS